MVAIVSGDIGGSGLLTGLTGRGMWFSVGEVFERLIEPFEDIGMGVTFTGYVYLYGLIYGLISGLLYKSASGLAWRPHYAYYFAFYILIDTF